MNHSSIRPAGYVGRHRPMRPWRLAVAVSSTYAVYMIATMTTVVVPW